MKANILKRITKDKNQETKQSTNLRTKEENNVNIQNKGSIFQISRFQQLNALMKLRISVSVIFFLCTISMIFIFLGGWVLSALLLLIGYIFLFILMIKLFLVKKL
ncbi:MAG: hypothetical protein BV459_07080 [Thermoplasmata archaeon M11B2D]|nr:MAG: hypothetical protein BV459_07080 [Thermoplasmata archaeon M11B2D]